MVPRGPRARATAAWSPSGSWPRWVKSRLLEIQFDSALDRGELDVDQVREVVVHLTHYVGWPLATDVNAAAERAIAKRPPGPTDGGRRGDR